MNFGKEALGVHAVGPGNPLLLKTDWHWWGYDHTVVRQPYTEGTNEPGPFRVIIRLSRLDATTPQPITINDAVSEYLDGDSNYSFETAKRTIVVTGGSQRVEVEMVHNGQGSLAALRFGPFKARNRVEAAGYARAIFAQMSAYLSVIFDVPLEAVATVVVGPDDHVLISTIRVPYPVVPVGDFNVRAPKLLLSLFALYDDALRSRSRFYSFLCYFKIADFVLRTIFPRLTKLKKALNQAPDIPIGTLPADPFRHIARDLIGQSFTKVRDAFYKPFRVEIAHFNEGGPLRPDDPAMVDRITQAEHVMRYIAKETLRTCVYEIQSMAELGVLEISFDTGVLELNPEAKRRVAGEAVPGAVSSETARE